MESVDNWNQYDSVLTEFVPWVGDVVNYYCVGGISKDSDGTCLFRSLIVDRETNDIYRNSFNADWCPDEQREWLWNITTRQQVDTISTAKRLQKNRTSKAWSVFCKTFA